MMGINMVFMYNSIHTIDYITQVYTVNIHTQFGCEKYVFLNECFLFKDNFYVQFYARLLGIRILYFFFVFLCNGAYFKLTKCEKFAINDENFVCFYTCMNVFYLYSYCAFV